MLVNMNITKDIINTNSTITNDALIVQAKATGKLRGEEYAKLHNNGFFTMQLVTKPTVSYQLGDKVSLSIPSYPDFNTKSPNETSLVSKVMMVTDIQWTIDSTLFTLEEEGAVWLIIIFWME